MKSKSAEKVHIASYDELLQPDVDQNDTKKDRIQEIALSELHLFKNHPFKVRDDVEMDKLVKSIKENGVLVPAFARPCTSGGYELISGHRRHRACEIAGLSTMPVIVKNIDDDQAVVSMVDSNLQREALLPSERAFAYRMKLDAMKRQGKRTDLTSCQVGTKLRADQQLAENVGDSARTVQRYIRLTELVPELLKMVDDKKIAFNSAVELSYLNIGKQTLLLKVMEKEKTIPSLSQAQRLKRYSQQGKLTEDVMDVIMTEEKGKAEKITLHRDKLKKYFPPSYTSEQVESIIFSLLEKWREEKESNKT